jgi:Phage integrase family
VVGLTEPKSRRSKRRVPVPRPLGDLLEAHQQRTSRDGADYIVGTTATRPFKYYEGRAEKAREAVNAARAEAELDPIRRFTIHQARHTYGAFCRAAGISMDDASDYLGHSRGDIGVTARYTSAVERDLRDADNMAKLATYLARSDSKTRITQLDEPRENDGLTRVLVERFAGDPEGLDRFLDDVRGALEKEHDDAADIEALLQHGEIQIDGPAAGPARAPEGPWGAAAGGAER